MPNEQPGTGQEGDGCEDDVMTTWRASSRPGMTAGSPWLCWGFAFVWSGWVQAAVRQQSPAPGLGCASSFSAWLPCWSEAGPQPRQTSLFRA